MATKRKAKRARNVDKDFEARSRNADKEFQALRDDLKTKRDKARSAHSPIAAEVAQLRAEVAKLKAEKEPKSGPASLNDVSAIAAAGEKLSLWNRGRYPPKACGSCGSGRWRPSTRVKRGEGKPLWECAVCGEAYMGGVEVVARMSPGLVLYGHFRSALLASHAHSSKNGVGPDVRSWQELTGQEQQAWEFSAGAPVVFNMLTGESVQRDDEEAVALRQSRAKMEEARSKRGLFEIVCPDGQVRFPLRTREHADKGVVAFDAHCPAPTCSQGIGHHVRAASASQAGAR
jgi:hypothetical protein